VPIRERNGLLVAAGLPPAYASLELTHESMSPVRRVIERILRTHEPYPAWVGGRGFRFLSSNRSAEALFPGLCGLPAEAVVDPSARARRAPGTARRLSAAQAERPHHSHDLDRHALRHRRRGNRVSGRAAGRFPTALVYCAHRSTLFASPSGLTHTQGAASCRGPCRCMLACRTLSQMIDPPCRPSPRRNRSVR
jgi:hypothetical protein